MTDVRHGSGKNITLPSGMGLERAITILRDEIDLQADDERFVTIEETIHGYPYEVVYVLQQALEAKYSKVIQFDKLEGERMVRATLISVPISANETVQVPWGYFKVKGLDGHFRTHMKISEGTPSLLLEVSVRREEKSAVQRLCQTVRRRLKKESLYREKAIKVHFRDENGQPTFDPPTFMDLSEKREAIYARSVEQELEENLFLPIRMPDEVAKMNVPKKRGILLPGTYGTGKTLTAYIVAQECAKVGRTFIYVEKALELPDALMFARAYSPALVFCEDVDRVTFGSRTAKMDELLNTVDGLETKDLDMITVLTTNQIELIHPAFLREGRNDAIIHIDTVDSDAAMRLVRHYGGTFIPDGEELHHLARHLQGKTPAFIREVVERCKLAELRRTGSVKRVALTEQALENAFHRHNRGRKEIEEKAAENEEMHRIAGVLSQMGGGDFAPVGNGKMAGMRRAR